MAKAVQTQPKFGQAIRVVVVVLALVGLGVAIRRELYLTRLVQPFINPKFGAFDANIDDQALLTWLHIVPGSLLLLLGPFQLWRKFRTEHPNLHRWYGRVYIVAGVIVGVTALVMSILTPIGGTNETVATMLFALLFLFGLLKAYLHIRRREIKQHREWMIRAFAIALAIATVRPIVALFFVFSNLQPREFFGIAFWLGFTIHLIGAELWINYTRQKYSYTL